MGKKTVSPILFAVLAAGCYSVSAPVSKILLNEVSPTLMAALLYLGAGFGMFIVNLFRMKGDSEARVTRNEWPYIAGMIALDVAAPISFMFGLTMTTPANASLLNNFEIVATSVIALTVFKEAIGKRMWIAITFITISSIVLSFDDMSSLSFSIGSLLVLAACLCWGMENNCTRMLSLKNPIQIVIVKGIGSGVSTLIIAIAIREATCYPLYILFALLLGFFAYGLSIFFYIKAQRELGAARTSAYYAIAPFVGTGLSFIIFRQPLTAPFIIALAMMIAGAYLAAFERHRHTHLHEAVSHEHRHSHDDRHHNHDHNTKCSGEHSHEHDHAACTHEHVHTPDLHHKHSH